VSFSIDCIFHKAQIKKNLLQPFLETMTGVFEGSGTSDSKDSEKYSVLFICPDTSTILPKEILF